MTARSARWLTAALALLCGCAAPADPASTPACIALTERGITHDPPEFAACSGRFGGCPAPYSCHLQSCALRCGIDSDCAGTRFGDRVFCFSIDRLCVLGCATDADCVPGTRCRRLPPQQCPDGSPLCERLFCQPSACRSD